MAVGGGEAHRAALQRFFAAQPPPFGLPVAALQLLRYDFGWSSFVPQTICAVGLDATLHRERINGIDLSKVEGLHKLALKLAGDVEECDDTVQDGGTKWKLARLLADEVNRPVVREETFRAFFAWLEHSELAKKFADGHFGSLQMFVMCAVTDTWSAVRKASAKALGSSVAPLLSMHRTVQLYEKLLGISQGLVVSRDDTRTGVRSAMPAMQRGRSESFISSPERKFRGSQSPKDAASFNARVGESKSTQGAWKVHEGVMLGVATLLKKLGHASVQGGADGHARGLRCGTAAAESRGTHSASPCAGGRGAHADAEAPAPMLDERIFDDLRPTLYRLLAHPQISVRQTAEAVFLVALGASELSVSQATFAEVVSRLDSAACTECVRPPDSPYVPAARRARSTGGTPAPRGPLLVDFNAEEAEATRHNPFLQLRPSKAEPEEDISEQLCAGLPRVLDDAALLPPFDAEGLLGLLVAMLAKLPSVFLLRNWPQYWGVLDRYLSHQASTVRQKASLFFKELLDAAPDRLQPILARLVVQSLVSGWQVDVAQLTNLDATTPSPQRLAQTRFADDACTEAADEAQLSPMRSSRGVRSLSVDSPPLSVEQPSPRSPADATSLTWQWREGRLLALELALDFVQQRHAAEHGLLELAALDVMPAEQGASLLPVSTAATPISFTRSSSTPSLNASRASSPSSSHPRPVESFSSDPELTPTLPPSSWAPSRLSPSLPSRTPSFSAAAPRTLHSVLERMRTTVSKLRVSISKEETAAPTAAPPRCEMSSPFEGACASSPSSAFAAGMAPLLTLRSAPPPCSARASGVWTVDVDESEMSQWLATLRWVPLHTSLQHALLQAISCFADRRFELRRMADQVLRPLAEVALWAELPVLKQAWETFLPMIDSLPCWVSSSTLLLALQRTSQLRQLAPPAEAGSQAMLAALSDAVTGQLPTLLAHVARLVENASSDKLCVLGLQLFCVLHARFAEKLRLSARQQRNHFGLLLHVLSELMHAAHPNIGDGSGGSANKAAEGGGSSRAPSKAASSDAVAEGPARRSSKSTSVSDGAHALLVERSVIAAIHCELPQLVLRLEFEQRQQLLPWLLMQLTITAEQPILLSLLDAVQGTLQPHEASARLHPLRESVSSPIVSPSRRAAASPTILRRHSDPRPGSRSPSPAFKRFLFSYSEEPEDSAESSDSSRSKQRRGQSAGEQETGDENWKLELLAAEGRLLEAEPLLLASIQTLLCAPSTSVVSLRRCLAILGMLSSSHAMDGVLGALSVCLLAHGAAPPQTDLSASAITQQLRALVPSSPDGHMLASALLIQRPERGSELSGGDSDSGESDWDDWDDPDEQEHLGAELFAAEIGAFLLELAQTDASTSLVEAALLKLPRGKAAVLLASMQRANEVGS